VLGCGPVFGHLAASGSARADAGHFLHELGGDSFDRHDDPERLVRDLAGQLGLPGPPRSVERSGRPLETHRFPIS
jgi:hypothetical protein